MFCVLLPFSQGCDSTSARAPGCMQVPTLAFLPVWAHPRSDPSYPPSSHQPPAPQRCLLGYKWGDPGPFQTQLGWEGMGVEVGLESAAGKSWGALSHNLCGLRTELSVLCPSSSLPLTYTQQLLSFVYPPLVFSLPSPLPCPSFYPVPLPSV